MTTIPCVDVPEGQCGDWRVERFTVDDRDVELENIRCMFSPGMGHRTMKAGTYTRLMRGDGLVMSDTDAEKRDHWEPVWKAKGIILLNGLGLGMVLNACLLKPEVEKAVVVEKSEEVIKLCGEHYKTKFNGRLQIVHADALTWKPPKKVHFGMIWHDIWNDICSDNLESMKLLHRRYGRHCDWQGSWCRDLCRR